MRTFGKYRTRCLGGTLLVLKGLNDCVTIERDKMQHIVITCVEGDWTNEEKREAMEFWKGSDAARR